MKEESITPNHSQSEELKEALSIIPITTEGSSIKLDDEYYLHRLFETDPQAGCCQLFKQYFASLCSHAARFVYSRQMAEDIVSEVFCTLWENKLYQGVGRFKSYLFTAVRNKAMSALRQEFCHRQIMEKKQESKVERPSDSFLLLEETQLKLKELVSKMAPRRQQVFLLCRFQGKSSKEVAHELGLSIRTVETHMYEALKFIRKGLADQDLL